MKKTIDLPLGFFFLYSSNFISFKKPPRERFKSKPENIRETIAVKISDNKAKQLVDVSDWRKAIRNT